MGWKKFSLNLKINFENKIISYAMVSHKTFSSGKSDTVIRGKPKSGRIWRKPGHKKSSIICVKPLHKSWTKKMSERVEAKSVKQFESEMKDEKRQEKEKRRAGQTKGGKREEG